MQFFIRALSKFSTSVRKINISCLCFLFLPIISAEASFLKRSPTMQYVRLSLWQEGPQAFQNLNPNPNSKEKIGEKREGELGGENKSIGDKLLEAGSPEGIVNILLQD